MVMACSTIQLKETNIDNNKVGLEAAIFTRKRNSSFD
jgi:hypothetical protein